MRGRQPQDSAAGEPEEYGAKMAQLEGKRSKLQELENVRQKLRKYSELTEQELEFLRTEQLLESQQQLAQLTSKQRDRIVKELEGRERDLKKDIKHQEKELAAIEKKNNKLGKKASKNSKEDAGGVAVPPPLQPSTTTSTSENLGGHDGNINISNNKNNNNNNATEELDIINGSNEDGEEEDLTMAEPVHKPITKPNVETEVDDQNRDYDSETHPQQQQQQQDKKFDKMPRSTTVNTLASETLDASPSVSERGSNIRNSFGIESSYSSSPDAGYQKTPASSSVSSSSASPHVHSHHEDLVIDIEQNDQDQDHDHDHNHHHNHHGHHLHNRHHHHHQQHYNHQHGQDEYDDHNNHNYSPKKKSGPTTFQRMVEHQKHLAAAEIQAHDSEDVIPLADHDHHDHHHDRDPSMEMFGHSFTDVRKRLEEGLEVFDKWLNSYRMLIQTTQKLEQQKLGSSAAAPVPAAPAAPATGQTSKEEEQIAEIKKIYLTTSVSILCLVYYFFVLTTTWGIKFNIRGYELDLMSYCLYVVSFFFIVPRFFPALYMAIFGDIVERTRAKYQLWKYKRQLRRNMAREAARKKKLEKELEKQRKKEEKEAEKQRKKEEKEAEKQRKKEAKQQKKDAKKNKKGGNSTTIETEEPAAAAAAVQSGIIVQEESNAAELELAEYDLEKQPQAMGEFEGDNDDSIAPSGSKASKGMIGLTPVYNEDSEAMKRTIFSLLAAKQFDPQLNIIHILILDGIGTDQQRETLRQLKELLDLDSTPAGTWSTDGVVFDHFSIVKEGVEFRLIVKPVNKGKRDSQMLWFKYIQDPEIFPSLEEYKFSLFVDSDTRFEPNSVSLLYDCLKKHDDVGGVCGEIIPDKPMKDAFFLWSWAQYHEYKMSHILNKAAESCFGMVTCLPGAFCMIRNTALLDIQADFCREQVHGVWKLNMLKLGEDRYMTTLLLQHGWKTKFVRPAKSYTITPGNLISFIKQRRRWTNSTLVNMVLLVTSRNMWMSWKRPLSFFLMMNLTIDFLSSLVQPASFYYLASSSIITFTDQFGIPRSVPNVFLLSWMIAQVFITGNGTLSNPLIQKLYRINCLIAGFGMMFVFPGTFFLALRYSTVQDEHGIFLLYSTLVYVVMLIIISVVTLEVKSLIFGIAYVLTLPTVFITLFLHSLFNFDELSWGR